MTKTRKVFIAIPTLDGTLRVSTTLSLCLSVAEGIRNDIQIDVHCRAQDPLLPHARNVFLAQFLAGDYTDIVFIDADIGWEPPALARLLGHPVDFVAGAYRFKNDKEGYPIGWLREDNRASDAGLFEVARVPAGFFRMTRAGVERVVKACPHLEYDVPSQPGLQCWYLFDLKLINRQAVGEDYVFCDLIRSLGETVWIDPQLALTHTGAKTFDGNLGTFLNEIARQKLPEDERKAHEAKLIQFAQTFTTPEMQRLFKAAMGEAA